MNDNCSKSEHAHSLYYSEENNHAHIPKKAIYSYSENTSDQLSKMLQVDGNDSLSSTSSDVTISSSSSLSSSIVQSESQYSALPKLYSVNARSIFPKFDDMVEKLLNHTIDVLQISETWHDVHKQGHNDKIDILEHRYGFKWHGFARPKYRENGQLTGGGGTAILVNQRNFISSIIDEIVIPKNVEIVWVKVIPKHTTVVKAFIFCGIYSKPSSKTKTILNDHIAQTYHILKMKHDSVKFFFLGDFNDHKPDTILKLSSQLRQIVHYPTCGSSILDLIITDAHTLYHPPIPEPPLVPDDPSAAAPSDHSGNLLFPKSIQGIRNNRQYKSVNIRPITQSKLSALGKWIVQEDWHSLDSENDTNKKLDLFTNIVKTMLDEIAPTKTIKISCDDPAWMNARIKACIRKRNREYQKHRSSNKYNYLKKKCRKLCKTAKTDFANNFVTNLKDKDPKTWMAAMKKLGKANHEKEADTWHFENEVKNDQDLCEEIAEYFAEISGSFPPLDSTLIPFIPEPYTPFVSEVNCFPEDYEIYQLLKGSKKSASVPHDFPIPFLKEFLPELTKPINNIYCQAIASGIFPTRWKNEYVSPHPKILPPSSYKDLRNLSLTEFLSKSFERFILNGTSSVNGLLHYVRKYVDPKQFAVSGSSCSHALIQMIDFILHSTDDSSMPTAVINLLADWSKAFNKCNHNIMMRILTAMNIPMWLLRLLKSYLQNRKMILRFRGCCSDPKDMPGGMPQGTLLGVILYILYINPVGFPSEVTTDISDIIHDYWKVLEDFPNIKPNSETLPDTLQSIKFMDDATLQEKVNLQDNLATNIDRSGLLPFWELGSKQQNGQVLPRENSPLQLEINKIKKLSDSREMTLNASKTCSFVVNFTQQYQFRPRYPSVNQSLIVCWKQNSLATGLQQT